MQLEHGAATKIARLTARRLAVALLVVLPAAALLGFSSGATGVAGERVAAAAAVAPGAVAPAEQFLSAEPDPACPEEPRAAVDYFLKIDGIDGEATAPGKDGSIQIESWSWGATQMGSHAGGGGGGAGKVQMNDFHFTMKVNKASPKLMLACATGQHIKEAVLFVRKSGGSGEELMRVKLHDVLVSSYQTGGSGGEVPTDQISLNFSKIEFQVGDATVVHDTKPVRGR